MAKQVSPGVLALRKVVDDVYADAREAKKQGKGKIIVLQRLVDAYAAGTHVNTKILMDDTGCLSPANLFSKTSPWKNYLAKVKGTHGWQLNLPILDATVDDDDDKIETEEAALIG